MMIKMLNGILNNTPGDGQLMVWWLGQEGYIFKSKNITVCVDPYLSTYVEHITKGQLDESVRMTKAPVSADALDFLDLIVCTHDHIDHIDPVSIPVIAKASANAKFVVPKAAERKMLELGVGRERIYTLRGDDSIDIDNIKINAIPAKHEEFDFTEEYGYPYLSYIMNIDGFSILHAGDTIPYPGQRDKLGNFDIDMAFLPINGRCERRRQLGMQGNFTYNEAVELASILKPRITVPMHYDMFSVNTADIEDFKICADVAGIDYKILQCGSLYINRRVQK